MFTSKEDKFCAGGLFIKGHAIRGRDLHNGMEARKQERGL